MILYDYNFIITYYYVIIISFLHYHYAILASWLQMGNHVIMIPLLRVMQRVSLYYYFIITHFYIIITPGSIETHYYMFQSPELDGGENTCFLNGQQMFSLKNSVEA